MTECILVPIDLEQTAAMDLVFPEAIDAARHHQASLQLLTVLPNITVGMFPYVPRGNMDNARVEAQQRLEALGNERVPDDIAWSAKADVGPLPHTIVTQAEAIGARLIVMASHDPKTIDLLLGSVADQVIRRAHCSVLVVRAPRVGAGR